jgi:hypothetical protein
MAMAKFSWYDGTCELEVPQLKLAKPNFFYKAIDWLGILEVTTNASYNNRSR